LQIINRLTQGGEKKKKRLRKNPPWDQLEEVWAGAQMG